MTYLMDFLGAYLMLAVVLCAVLILVLVGCWVRDKVHDWDCRRRIDRFNSLESAWNLGSWEPRR